MNIYTGLLFQQGYIQDPKLAMSLAHTDEQAAQQKVSGSDEATRGQAQRPERKASFRRGAIFAVCSTALSPFR